MIGFGVMAWQTVFSDIDLKEKYMQETLIFDKSSTGNYNFTALGNTKLLFYTGHYFSMMGDSGYAFTLKIYNSQNQILFSKSYDISSGSSYQEGVTIQESLFQTVKGGFYRVDLTFSRGSGSAKLYSPKDVWQQFIMDPNPNMNMFFFWGFMGMFFVGICILSRAMKNDSKNFSYNY
jgi:hypothetical protein